VKFTSRIFCFFIAVLFCHNALAAEKISAPHVIVTWLAPTKFEHGKLNPLGIYFQLEPEWHVYWVNPGDSGAAPKFYMNSSIPVNTYTGIHELTPVRWPFPHRIPVEHLTNIGYEKEVAFPFTLTPAPGAKNVKLEVKLEWLVCKIDCIPGFGTLTLERPVTGPVANEEEKWEQGQLITLVANIKKTPQTIDESPFEVISAERTSSQILVNVKSKSAAVGGAPELFPLDGNLAGATQPEVKNISDGYQYALPLMPGAPATKDTGFLLVADGTSYEFLKVPITGTAPKTDPNPSPQSLLTLLLLSLIGGFILNLMPCVFPVISLKFFSLIKPESDARSRLRQALLYTAGVVSTFLILGGTLAALRASGMAVGWGFHLQIILFWLMALNFWGLFEFGDRLMNIAGRKKWNSSFGVGILSVFVAAPCTGPFMGAALGATAILPAGQGLLIFVALGLGLASPFLILAITPKLLALLPKPGPWMNTFKEFMGFLMAATVIWLLFVLAAQVGDTGWLIAAIMMLLIGLVCWSRPRWPRASKIIFVLVLLLTIYGGQTLHRIGVAPATASANSNSPWQPFDKEAIAKARAEGRSVFIDFTAAWCITCQVNKKNVLETEGALKYFASRNTYLSRADWTNYDPVITATLAEFGRNSVPTYLYYPAGSSSAKILPQILSLSIIENLQ
jgi:DsbC/DsbD-like thiol-disulfide interchange protein/cytochrome c biogenesis protein CcdA